MSDLPFVIVPKSAALDTARLDFLDRLNASLNERYGTNYRWEMIFNHNVTRLMLGGHLVVDLNDAKAHGLPSCRDAIDGQMRKAPQHVSAPPPVSLEEIVEVLTTVLPLVEQAEFLESRTYSYGGGGAQPSPAEWGIAVAYQQSKDAMPGQMFAADVEAFHQVNRDEDEGDGRFLTEANKLRSLLSRLKGMSEEKL